MLPSDTVLQKLPGCNTMKSRIEKLVPDAIVAAGEIMLKAKKDENGNVVIDKNGNTIKYIPKEFKGYISSFGASVIQSGLIPALAFFSNDEGAKEDRSKILDVIYQILEINSPPGNLLKYVVDNGDNELLKEQIMDAATALKLAIRTYKLV